MKTIFKILSLVILISLTSCDRPIEPTDYLDNRAPLVGFQGAPDVFFMQNEENSTYEIFVGVSAKIDTAVSYTITNDAESVIAEGVEFELEGSFTIPSGEFSGSFIVNFDYDALPAGPSQLFLNLSSEGDAQIGAKNQYDLTVIKI